MIRRHVVVAFVLVAGFSMVDRTHANSVVNKPLDLAGGIGWSSDAAGTGTADNFDLSEDAIITEVIFQGWQKRPDATEEFRIDFVSDIGGNTVAPTVIASSNNSITGVGTGTILEGQAEFSENAEVMDFRAILQSPVELDAGAYWIIIQGTGNPDTVEQFIWSNSTPSGDSSDPVYFRANSFTDYNPLQLDRNEQAFVLIAIPEPAAISMLVVMLPWFRRRQAAGPSA